MEVERQFTVKTKVVLNAAELDTGDLSTITYALVQELRERVGKSSPAWQEFCRLWLSM